MNTLDAEDTKLVTLARSSAARIGAADGAAVRDEMGRTYAAAGVSLPSLTLSALQLAVAQAVAAGASDIEAAVVFSADGADDAGIAAVHDVGKNAKVYAAFGDAVTRVTT